MAGTQGAVRAPRSRATALPKKSRVATKASKSVFFSSTNVSSLLVLAAVPRALALIASKAATLTTQPNITVTVNSACRVVSSVSFNAICEAWRNLDDRFHESDSMLGVLTADSHFIAS
jgi:hypothetical protein